jgi:NADH-quinone oxidoreductase subunit J
VTAVLFYIFAAITLLGAIGVVMARHIVHAAMQLLLTLLGVAGLYFMLNAEFLAAVQLVIYVGGTLVLLIFGVMLTSHLGTRLVLVSRGEAVIVSFAGLCLLGAIIIAIVNSHFASAPPSVEPDVTRRLGMALLSDYLVPFEIASVLMLAVMVGAAYLAKRPPKDGR